MSHARARVAHACLGTLPPAELGSIVLRDAQRFVVARARRALGSTGGALVAEDVGRGKTFIALAIARGYADPLVIAPASICAEWRAASERAATPVRVVSTESLSRSAFEGGAPDLVIVDESHHFRNPATRRYGHLAQVAASAPLLLLSATPLQNRVADLCAQLALFLGERAFTLDEEHASGFVIRASATGDDLPHVSAPEWLECGSEEDAVLDALMSLPAPPRPLDGGDAGALRLVSLLRAWTSSRAALEAAVGTRRRVSIAIGQALGAGRLPTRAEAAAWIGSRETVQLGFASLLVAHESPAEEVDGVLEVLHQEEASLDALRRLLTSTPDSDVGRARGLLALRDLHCPRRILVFSEFASTIRRLFQLTVGSGHVGMSTATECRIASGALAREELLARFAPRSQRSPGHVAPHEAVTMLLTTDLLSEGVNLQDASVVVHMDLPWNPARLRQRVGRVRRPDGEDEIHSFLMKPPARAESLLRMDRLLRTKLAQADLAIGHSFDILPVLPGIAAGVPRLPLGYAESEGELLAIIRCWSSEAVSPAGGIPSAAYRGSRPAWLAALSDGTLLSSEGESVVSLLRVARVIDEGELLAGDEADEYITDANANLGILLASRRLDALCGLQAADGNCRRQVGRWLDALVHDAGRHERATILPLVARIRVALDAPMPIGRERWLMAMSREPVGSRDEIVPRLQRVAVITATTPPSDANPRVAALLVAVPYGFTPSNLATRPRGPTANPDVGDTICTELYATASVCVQVRPPSLETSVPLRPTAMSNRPFDPGAYDTAERYPCGEDALSTTVQVRPPSDVSARLRPPSFAFS